MHMDEGLQVADDFEYLLTFLPAGWEAKAKELGALRRCRRISDAKTLLRLLLIHLAEGCSLRETALRAHQGHLADVSDVAIMDRLRLAGDWFCWMCGELMRMWIGRQPSAVFRNRWNVRVVDATRVTEPGPTGSSWCVHYSIDLPALRCRELAVTDYSGSGETFKKYHVEPSDLFVGDRAFGTPPSIWHVFDGGGEVLVRFGWNRLPLWASETERFDLLAHLQSLRGTEVGDWDVIVKYEGCSRPGRVCALSKSRQAAEKARRDLKQISHKHGGSLTLPETIESAGYIFVFTSVSRNEMTPTAALEMYRGRWQIELVFKRLKSLLGFGHLRKKDPEAARSWLHGKLLVALLIEALIRHGEALFPWGYPIETSHEP